MTDFKVGDRVRVVSFGTAVAGYPLGQTGTVKLIDDYVRVVMDEPDPTDEWYNQDGYAWHCRPDEIEKVEA